MTSREEEEQRIYLDLLPTITLIEALERRFNVSIIAGLRNLNREEVKMVFRMSPSPASKSGLIVPEIWGTMNYLIANAQERLTEFLRSSPFKDGLDMGGLGQ